MSYVIIILTLAGLAATLYSRWTAKQQLLNDESFKKEQARVDALKVAIEATEKELQDAGKDYNSVYNAYVRKYHTGPRDDQPK